MKIDAILANAEDNIAVALREIKPNEEVNVRMGEETRRIRILGNIPHGHKFAVKEIAPGEDIIKHREVIGRATQNITTGDHAHVHNIESIRGRGDRA